MLRIATWNLARPASATTRRSASLSEHMRAVDADVWILTEAHEEMSPDPSFHRVATAGSDRPASPGERWTIIWTRLRIIEQLATVDPIRTVCVRLEEPSGRRLLVYGTVLPWLGSAWRGTPGTNGAAFAAALEMQATDWRDLRDRFPDEPLCLAGDFNQDLCERHFYGSRRGREALRRALAETGLVCVTSHPHDPVRARTAGGRANIDHICLSRSLAGRQCGVAGAWPHPDSVGRRLTDHFGVWVDLADGSDSQPDSRKIQVNSA